jgi:hypothetical protein
MSFYENPLELWRNDRRVPILQHPDFIKNKLLPNHWPDNLMKPHQTLHNYHLYHLFKPPLKQFDDISLDRATSQVILW